MARKKRKKREVFHVKLKEKENRIRHSRIDGETVDLSDEKIKSVMSKYGVSDYRIELWGDIHMSTKFDNWRISLDDKAQVVRLYHENKKLVRIGNERSSYHLHNVYYDLDFCIESILRHEKYKNELKNKNYDDT